MRMFYSPLLGNQRAKAIALLPLMLALLTACLSPNALPSSTTTATPPPFEWDHDPARLLLEADIACLLGNEVNFFAQIPARIWGDGRVVWVEYEDDIYGPRRVLEGHLSEDELRALMQ